jgi:hypothetical protein
MSVGREGTLAVIAHRRVEAVVDDDQLDCLIERLEVEGDLGTALGGVPRLVFVADLIGSRPFGAEGIPGVGEPPVRIGFQYELLGAVADGVGQCLEHLVHGGQPQLLIFMSSG